MTLEAYEEHDVVKKLLQELSRAKSPTDEWEAQAKVLQENVEHHVEEEENELFKKAKAVLSQDEIETLGEQMESEKQRQQRMGSKAGAKKSAKKSASKSQSASRAPKRTPARKSASKSSSKSSGSKGSRSKKSAKKGRR